MKVCSKCGIEKEASEFYSSKRCSDGLQSRCKHCNKSDHAKHYQKDKAKYKNRSSTRRKRITAEYTEWKSKQVCCRCGETDEACLDAHHIDPSQKEFQLAKLGQEEFGTNRWFNELAKCIIVCANCHRKIHKYEICVRGGMATRQSAKL